MGRVVVTGRSDLTITGEVPGSVQLNVEGNVMPAFSFEKLSPPADRRSESVPAPAAKKPRRLFGHMIDRLVEARVRKNLRKRRIGTPQQPG